MAEKCPRCGNDAYCEYELERGKNSFHDYLIDSFPNTKRLHLCGKCVDELVDEMKEKKKKEKPDDAGPSGVQAQVIVQPNEVIAPSSTTSSSSSSSKSSFMSKYSTSARPAFEDQDSPPNVSMPSYSAVPTNEPISFASRIQPASTNSTENSADGRLHASSLQEATEQAERNEENSTSR